jgi:hypothetical protein
MRRAVIVLVKFMMFVLFAWVNKKGASEVFP